jgi:NADH-quinone oxidoreductase subunit G
MTVTTTGPGSANPVPADLLTLTIDGIETSVPKGTLVIRAAEQLGFAIPRFCDHPLLEPVGACRQCLVEVEGQRKPLASCTTTVTDGMVVRTQLASVEADKAQQGVMEMLLINHPLDCPICDKGGECPLQNQAMSNGRGESRFDGPKRTFPKPIPVSSQVLLDRERCVSCARCTRFSAQIAGDPFIELLERGSDQQVGIADGAPFASYFSGNTVQICPVGALTGTAYRFRARPFDLVSARSACEHCASGCALRTDHRRGVVVRRLAANDPEVNEEWNCDKGRWAFAYAPQAARITSPLVRDEDGHLVPTSWPDALDVAARGLAAAREAGGVGVLPGGRVTLEDAYAWSKFARVALGTNDIDHRARTHSAEETAFLGASVAGTGLGVTYAQLESAPAVLLVGLEPEEESPIIFLRLRKASRRGRLRVAALAPYATRGLTKMSGVLVPTVPGAEPGVLESLASGTSTLDETTKGVADSLRAPGAVILAGERLAGVAGALTAVLRLADATGARVAWVPRRAGERGAVEAGTLPALLAGGRPVADPAARVDVATAWGLSSLPAAPGLDTTGILAAAANGALGGLVVGGVDPVDLPDPALALAALQSAGFVVSLELRPSAVTEQADVVLPVAAVAEKGGTFLDWEGRPRPFDAAIASQALSDARVLSMLSEEMGAPIHLDSLDDVRRQLDELETWEGARPDRPSVVAAAQPSPAAGEAVLATWRMLLDLGTLQDGEPYLAGTAHPAVARISPATAAEVGAVDGGALTVTSDSGSVTVPLLVTAMPDRVVWLPAHSAGASTQVDLAAGAGSIVRISPRSSA